MTESKVIENGIEYTVINYGSYTAWYHNGTYHREDGPAIIWHGKYFSEEWYHNGTYHREDGPAIIWYDGVEEWYLEGKEIDRPAVEMPNAHKAWFVKGKTINRILYWLIYVLFDKSRPLV